MSYRIFGFACVAMLVVSCGSDEPSGSNEVESTEYKVVDDEIVRNLNKYPSNKMLDGKAASAIVTLMTDMDIYASLLDDSLTLTWISGAITHGSGHQFSCDGQPAVFGAPPGIPGNFVVNQVTQNRDSTEIKLRLENCSFTSIMSASHDHILVSGDLRLHVEIGEDPALANGKSCLFSNFNSPTGQYVKSAAVFFEDLDVKHKALSIDYPHYDEYPEVSVNTTLVKTNNISGYIQKEVSLSVNANAGLNCPDDLEYRKFNYAVESYSEDSGLYSYFKLSSLQNYNLKVADEPIISGALALDNVGAVSIKSASPLDGFPLSKPNYLLSFNNDNNAMIYAHGLNLNFQSLNVKASRSVSFYSADKLQNKIIAGVNLKSAGTLPFSESNRALLEQPWITIEDLNFPPIITIWDNRIYARFDGDYGIDVKVYDEESDTKDLMITYEWSVNGVVVLNDSVNTLSGGFVTSGDVLSVVVSVSDGVSTTQSQALELNVF